MEAPQHDPFAPPYEVDLFAPPGGVPSAAPSRVPRDVVALGLAIAVIGAAGVVAALGRSLGDDERPGPAASAGCGPMRDFALPLDASHQAGRVEYPDIAPYGGPHSPSPLPGFLRFVPRDGAPPDVPERAVHNLEHGYVVVWYGTDATAESLEELRDALRETPRKVMAVPWRGAGTFTLAAWGHLQSCGQPTADAINAFFAEHGGENGDAPEASAP